MFSPLKDNVCKFEHECNKCGKICTSQNYLHKHKKLCLGELKCYKCGKILSRKYTYLKHIKKS